MTEKITLSLVVFLAWSSSALCRWVAVSQPLDPAYGGILCLLPDPQQRDHWLIGTSLGVAESTDGGENFSFTQHSLPGVSFGRLIMDSDDPQWLWASYREHEDPHADVFCRSTDRGATWTQVSRFTEDQWFLSCAFGNRDTLLAFRSYVWGCYNEEFHVNRSTDGGATWTEYFYGEIGAGTVQARDSDLLYMIFSYYPEEYSQPFGILYRSADLGATWHKLNCPESYSGCFWRSLAVGGSHGDDLVLVNSGISGYSYGGIYCSTDRGDNWETIIDDSLPYYNPMDTQSLLYDGNGDIYNMRFGNTAPVMKRSGATGNWLPACWDVPDNAGSFLTAPWWDHESIYALLAGHAGGVQLYRYSAANTPPLIALAGWNPDFISASQGGDVQVFAYVVDAEDPLVNVEILYQNVPTGVMLTYAGGNLYQTTIHLPPDSLPVGYLMIELQATDPDGLTSMIWPYLRVGFRDEYPEPSPPAWNPNIAYYSPSSPKIIGGGWGFTGAVDAGFRRGNFVVFAGDPDGADDVNMVEVMWQALPTGWVLVDTDTGFNDFSYYAGAHGVAFETGGMTAGAYYFEVQARDTAGHRSGLWPYLTVTP